MIVKKVFIKDSKLQYFIGINTIIFNLNELLKNHALKNEIEALNFLFNLIERMQGKYNNILVQFFKDKYILNQEHVLIACYHAQKAFLDNLNISKKKNIELFLYLAANRQIKKSIEAFGIIPTDLIKEKLTYLVISHENNLNNINNEILKQINAKEIKTTLNTRSIEKYRKIKNFFEISDNQIEIVLNSLEMVNYNGEKTVDNLEALFMALLDLICEKMTLLSLEKLKIN